MKVPDIKFGLPEKKAESWQLKKIEEAESMNKHLASIDDTLKLILEELKKR